MCQLWIDLDESVDLIALARRTDHQPLREMAVFDAVINNADRKIGHLLPVADGHLYGCDHGICFAEEYKLRTVLWQWRGEPLPERAVEALRRPVGGPGGRLARRGAGAAPDPRRGHGHQRPRRRCSRQPRPPAPAGRLARRPLAPGY